MEAAMRFSALLLAAWVLTGVPALASDRQDLENCKMSDDADLAIASCTRVVQDQRLQPEMRAFALLARSLAREQRDLKGAMADLNEAIRLDPRTANAYSSRARLYTKAGDTKRSFADLNEAIRLDPKVALFYNRRGLHFYEERDYERAIAAAHYSRGVAYRMKGERELAIADFRQAVRISPLASIQSLNELQSLGVGGPKTETEALKQGVLDLLK
jgi:tetratricopeptide (TPR) repeat protein